MNYLRVLAVFFSSYFIGMGFAADIPSAIEAGNDLNAINSVSDDYNDCVQNACVTGGDTNLSESPDCTDNCQQLVDDATEANITP